MLKPILHFLGTRLARPIYGGIGSIFALHRVVPESERSRIKSNRALEITPEDLDGMLTLLRERGFVFVSMDDVPVRLRAGRGRFAAFTLDDAYRDNLVHALPVFRRHQVPFTVNATRSFCEYTDSVWWLALEEVLHGRDAISVSHAGRNETLPLADSAQRERAFEVLALWLRGSQLDERRDLLAAICNPVGVDPLRATRELVLDVAGLRELARDPLVTLGAHTLHHLTSNILSEAATRVEFAGSKEWLEEVTGHEAKHLAYPFGGRNAVGAREFRLAAECGFMTAVTTRFANLFPAHANKLHQLPRLEISGNYRVCDFTERAVSGLLPAMRNRWRRVVTG
jgi:peptidoglycan/xylan/chitin deacetylase (PgdA/CDA1 family)